MCNPHQEGHDHAKRHATFTMNKRGILLDEIIQWGVEPLDACFVDHHCNLHTQLTPWC